MPVYVYECGRCSHRFEMKQGFDDEPKAVCPRCEGKAKRVFQAAPVIFKGSGFYVTDHRPSQGKDKSADGGPGKKESKGEQKLLKFWNKSSIIFASLCRDDQARAGWPHQIRVSLFTVLINTGRFDLWRSR